MDGDEGQGGGYALLDNLPPSCHVFSLHASHPHTHIHTRHIAGIYARGAHTLATGQAQLEKLPAAVRSQKLVEHTLQELRVSADMLPMPTRTVSAAWLSLRNEVVEYVDLKRQLALRQGDGGRKKSKVLR